MAGGFVNGDLGKRAALYQGRTTGYFILACLVGSLGCSLFGYDLGVSVQNVQQRSLIFQLGSLNGFWMTASSGVFGKRKVVVHASLEIDGNDSSNSDALKDGAEDYVSVESLPLETKLQLKLEQKLKMKLARKTRLRRKRLVRKHRMRKNKNV